MEVAMSKNRLAIAAGLLVLLSAGPLLAADQGAADQGGPNLPGSKPPSSQGTQPSMSEERTQDQKTVGDAAQVVNELKSNPDTRDTLSQAKAVLIVPNYSRAALGIGGAGGKAVLAVNNNGNWSPPGFYKLGTINLGLQAGVEKGQIAFLIMSDKALQQFREENNFSLNADAGLSIVNWNKRAQISAGKGADVIAWSNTKGLYGDLAVSVTDISWDKRANRAYYGKKVAANDIFNGSVKEPMKSSPLEAEFSALESGGQGGTSNRK
jgi:lipid-binding SYLF domain-containing protein